MMLRVRIPQPLFLCGSTEDELKVVSVSFFYNHYAITLTFEGGEVEKATWVKPGEFPQWVRKTTHAMLVITETKRSRRPITDLITPPAHEDLLSLIEGATMKAIRVIRNVGFVPELPESLPRRESLEEILSSWHPEVSSDGTTWTRVSTSIPIPGFRSLFGFAGRSGFASNAELKMPFWSRIKEVLEDNLEIQPEDEFLTNTIGHLRTCNFRLAIVDAVIGLEIVLTRYLRSYLTNVRKLSKQRIDLFLRNDFGLTTRLAGILDLTMHESYLKEVKLDQVLQAVTWRNHIVHKTGQLPSHVPVVTVREHIDAVLDLANMLAKLYVDTSASPDMERIREKLKTNWSERISWLSLWIKPWHSVSADIECRKSEPLTREEMQAIAEELGGYLKARDKRFDPTIHLYVNFKYFMGESIGEYIFGRVFMKGELLLKPPSSGDSDNQPPA
jgi:hypothetical protein